MYISFIHICPTLYNLNDRNAIPNAMKLIKRNKKMDFINFYSLFISIHKRCSIVSIQQTPT